MPVGSAAAKTSEPENCTCCLLPWFDPSLPPIRTRSVFSHEEHMHFNGRHRRRRKQTRQGRLRTPPAPAVLIQRPGGAAAARASPHCSKRQAFVLTEPPGTRLRTLMLTGPLRSWVSSSAGRAERSLQAEGAAWSLPQPGDNGTGSPRDRGRIRRALRRSAPVSGAKQAPLPPHSCRHPDNGLRGRTCGAPVGKS